MTSTPATTSEMVQLDLPERSSSPAAAEFEPR